MSEIASLNGEKFLLPQTHLSPDKSSLILSSAAEVHGICTATKCAALKFARTGDGQTMCIAHEVNRSRPDINPKSLNPDCFIAQFVQEKGIKTASDFVRKLGQLKNI